MQELIKTLTDIVKVQKDDIDALQESVAELKEVSPITKRIEYIGLQVGVMGAIMPYLSNEQQAILVAEVVAELFNDDVVDKIKKFDFPQRLSVDNCDCDGDNCTCAEKPKDFDDVNDAIYKTWADKHNNTETDDAPEQGAESDDADAEYKPEIYNAPMTTKGGN